MLFAFPCGLLHHSIVQVGIERLSKGIYLVNAQIGERLFKLFLYQFYACPYSFIIFCSIKSSFKVVSDGKDLWLRKLLQESDGDDMKTLAGQVVQSAVKEYGRNDDMTALAIKVEVRT